MSDSQTLRAASEFLWTGQFLDAEQLLRGLVLREPGHADAWSLLGIALGQQEKLDESTSCFQRALELKPDGVEAQTNLGISLFKQRRLEEALTSLQAALTLKPDHVGALNTLGNVLAEQGRLEPAIEAYRQALRIQPDFAAAHINLGIRLLERGQPDEAVASLRQGLKLQPNSVEAMVNLGNGLKEQGKPDEALAYYEQAVRLRPGLAEAQNNWAAALTDLGRFDEAIPHFQEALRLKPDYAQALYGLGELALEGRCHLTAGEKARLGELLGRDSLPLRDRFSLHFLAAGLLDRAGAYGQAFAHYERANELRRLYFQQRGVAFDTNRHRDKVEELIAVFDRDHFRQVESFGSESDLPVFIVGIPRSGTTLVEQILASHPQVYGAGERSDLTQIASTLPRSKDDREGWTGWISPGASRSLAEQYLRRLSDVGGAALRVTNKLPENYLELGLIFTLFPRARVIHCRRNALDVCVSCYTQNFIGLPFTTSLEDIGHYYCAYQKLMAHWRAVLPRPLLEVDYEHLVKDPEAESRRLIAFCGLEWDERCLEFHTNRRAVQTASRLQVRRPVYTDSIGRWRKYQPYLKPLIGLLPCEAVTN
jgi:tetratricopeptide (TPR) repeat protein